MCGPLILLGLILPIAEVLILIEISGQIGFLYTLSLVTVTALLGLRFVQMQGLAILNRLRQGRVPQDATLLEGPLLVVAAVALLAPGIVTDLVGLTLLIPPFRRWVAFWLSRRMGRVSGLDSGSSSMIVVQVADDENHRPWKDDHSG